MDESKLCDNIRNSLKAKGINISEKDVHNLYIATMSSIYSILDEGKTVDISDFGSFWRKKTEPASVTFFKPIERLLERINTKRK
ncbi:nucleoid DNA-binding protein [Dysgonomonas alginatilytica]|uniref:Nucleoid DNA-binding protein n=1 Tax=Dysgonomonas alginatilytica TaxID=1605892 RepID=A0A2V3PMR3_9BACT|nr:HU family DNA-binding protein [Dysgonomonas alginatilytica]PXV61872.1 nucleoid DNA-binding protein [Dysgonomonas alginatilytica]